MYMTLKGSVMHVAVSQDTGLLSREISQMDHKSGWDWAAMGCIITPRIPQLSLSSSSEGQREREACRCQSVRSPHFAAQHIVHAPRDASSSMLPLTSYSGRHASRSTLVASARRDVRRAKCVSHGRLMPACPRGRYQEASSPDGCGCDLDKLSKPWAVGRIVG